MKNRSEVAQGLLKKKNASHSTWEPEEEFKANLSYKNKTLEVLNKCSITEYNHGLYTILYISTEIHKNLFIYSKNPRTIHKESCRFPVSEF